MRDGRNNNMIFVSGCQSLTWCHVITPVSVFDDRVLAFLGEDSSTKELKRQIYNGFSLSKFNPLGNCKKVIPGQWPLVSKVMSTNEREGVHCCTLGYV